MSKELKCDYCGSKIEELPNFHSVTTRLIRNDIFGDRIGNIELDFCCEQHLLDFFNEKRWGGTMYV